MTQAADAKVQPNMPEYLFHLMSKPDLHKWPVKSQYVHLQSKFGHVKLSNIHWIECGQSESASALLKSHFFG